MNKLRELIAEATPLPFHTERYAHGGARQWKSLENDRRELVADLYGNRGNCELYVYLRNNAEAIADLIEAAKEVIRISDRKHDAWDKAKEALYKLEDTK